MEKVSDNTIDAIRSCALICVDIETKDPKLTTHGPGTHRGDGYICGVGFGAIVEGEKLAFYLDVAHPDTSPETTGVNIKTINHILSGNSEKLGANIVYDLEWLTHEEFEIKDNGFHDVQYAEPLLDEYKRSYSLETLAKQYTNYEKKTDVIGAYASMMNWTGDPRKHIWKMPAEVVKEYVIGDVTLPLEIFERQKSALEAEGLWDVYKLETALIPSLLKMRKNGVKIDEKLFKNTIHTLSDRRFSLQKKLEKWGGKNTNFNSTKQLAELFDKHKIPYPLRAPTEKMRAAGKPGNPRLDKLVLSKLANDYDICATILEYRHFDTLINMFMHPYLDLICNGKLYGQFHPLRSDDYGTVAGRFSASKPNLQQVSAIDEDDDDGGLQGKILRALFIPEDDHDWAKLDYSQIEYRIMAHYAEGAAAEKLRHQYINNPATDMHQIICDETGFDRRTAKRLNFGGAYGMGINTASELFGWTLEEADSFMAAYHQAAPYVKSLRRTVSDIAARRGYIFTVLGRKARTHPSRKLHSMFNRLIQGSAADVMKKAIVDADKKGLFETLILHLTVHDELDVSKPRTKEGDEALEELKKTMEDAVKFDVPIIVDCHTGANWAEAD